MKRMARILLVGLLLSGLVSGGKAANGAEVQAGDTAEHGQVTIEIGLLSTPPGAEEWLPDEIAAFSKAYPNVDTRVLSLDSPSRFTRPFETLPALPENVTAIDSFSGYEAAYLAMRGEIVPIDAFLPDPDFSRGDFYENLWAPVTFGGKIWGVPWATSPMVLLCNWALFEKAGIAEPPRTWDEFMASAARLTQDTDGDGAIDQWGFGIGKSSQVQRMGLSMMLQKGGRIMTDTGFAPCSDKTVEVFAFSHALQTAEFTTRLSTAPPGSCAMQIAQLNDLGAIPPEQRPQFRLAFLPTFGPELDVDFGTMYMVIRKSTPEREAASWKFVKWLSRPDVPLPPEIGGYPCRKDFIEREDFKAMMASSFQGLDVAWRANARLTDLGPNDLMGRARGVFTLEKHIDEALAGNATITEAYDMAVEQANKEVTVIKPRADKDFELFR